MILDRAKAIKYYQLAVWYNFFPLLNLLTPRYVTESRRNHIALTEAKLERRMAATSPGRDFMSFILENDDPAVDRLSKVELTMLASNFIVAGSGTSAGGMSGLTYLLLRSPAKLARLRRRARRFRRLGSVLKKLFSGDVEKALTFLDERLLGATSNAVERGNRRYRKMQRSVYRVRTEAAINGRLALDLERERRARDRTETTRTLHRARAA